VLGAGDFYQTRWSKIREVGIKETHINAGWTLPLRGEFDLPVETFPEAGMDHDLYFTQTERLNWHSGQPKNNNNKIRGGFM